MTVPVLAGDAEVLAQLERAGLHARGTPLRLHLGCGEIKLDGYVNIDYPPAQHTVQALGAADIHADILSLRFPNESVDEIRLHHVFEHFDRPTAHALLGRWHQWLKVGGELRIETPDLRASSRMLNSARYSYQDHQVVLRHVFGSHEAAWAVHWDGWYEDKYKRVLSHLGFEELRFDHSSWKLTQNVTVRARKKSSRSTHALVARIATVLSDSLVDASASEQKLWGIWCERVRAMLPPEAAAAGDAPEVTVFIPVYNRERYLPATLESLLSQTFRDFEVLIADDGSTDGTLAIAREFAARDPRIRVLALPHGGEVAARNAAVRQANPRSRFFMNHDSDDISLPHKLQRLVHYLHEHSEISMVGCFATYFDDGGNERGAPALESEPLRISATFGEKNSMVNSATLIRRDVFSTLGGYRDAYRSVDDYDFFARALSTGHLAANIPDVLHRIRLHEGSISQTRARRTRLLVERVRADYAYARAMVPTHSVAGLRAGMSKRLRRARAGVRYLVEGLTGR